MSSPASLDWAPVISPSRSEPHTEGAVARAAVRSVHVAGLLQTGQSRSGGSTLRPASQIGAPRPDKDAPHTLAPEV